MTEAIKALLYGVLEGITEWLPISSTGHIILLRELVPLNVAPSLGARFADEYFEMFEVVIQLGAIFAVIVTFFGKLFPFSFNDSANKRSALTLWLKICVASLPAAFVGIVLDKLLEIISGKDIDGWIYTPFTVALALIVYGVLFIVVEAARKRETCDISSVDAISFAKVALIGGFQALSIIPGTSRSGSTILGARLLGVHPSAAAEFSFFMSIPAMAGGSLIKTCSFLSFVYESGLDVPLTAWLTLAVASVAAFAVSMMTIKALMSFVKKHSFAPFGIYRILLGALVIVYFLTR